MIRKILAIIILLIIVFVGCKRDRGVVEPNQPPWVEIKHPPANDSTNSYYALQTVSWDGSDNDGYPVLYRYKYTTYHLYSGDSFIQDWIETEKTQAEVAFESSDTLNLQKFEVIAIDNKGDSSSPDVRYYYTKRVERPETEILSPDDGDTLLFLPYTTDTYYGVPLVFRGWDFDEEGEIVGYSYRIDGKEWSSFDMDTSIYLRPTLFEPPEGIHTIEVKSKDNTNVEDATPAEIQIFLVVPSFSSSILLVDETRDGSGGPENPTDEDVDNFYRDILSGHTFDEWDYATLGSPGKTELGDYRLVIWHSDDQVHNLPNHTETIGKYLTVGGNFWPTGWGIISSFGSGSYEVGNFVYDYLHIKSSDCNRNNDFKGGIWDTGDSVLTDTTKLYPFRKGLHKISVVEGISGWTYPLVSFISLSSDPTYQGKTCGMKYEGTIYNTILLDFPLYYLKEEGARGLCEDILEFFDE